MKKESQADTVGLRLGLPRTANEATVSPAGDSPDSSLDLHSICLYFSGLVDWDG